jgi:putative spermidine/putrescine transport system ATP-binding protein
VIHLFKDGQIEQSGTPTSLYTQPRTRYAAEFIGNYNVFDKADFEKMIGQCESAAPVEPGAPDAREDKVHQSTSVAIRPETIEILPDGECEMPDRYVLPATVIDSTPRGNVLRYTLDVRGVRLHADTLFRSFALYPTGHKIMLSVEKRNCLPL